MKVRLVYVVVHRPLACQVDLQSAIDSRPLDSELLCGSISMILDKPGSLSGNQYGTCDVLESTCGTVSSGYCEVQLAMALQWDERRRKMILLEQLLARNDGGEYSGFELM